jgi:cytochrome c oxidase subunit 4
MSTHHEHVTNPKAEARGYLLNLSTLLFLTVVTVGASYIDFGQGNVVIALAIATVKATLVGLFFMHLAHDKPVNALIAIAGFVFLGLFLLFDLLDISTRRDAIPLNLPAVQTAPATPGAGGPGTPGAAAPATPGTAAPASVAPAKKD